MRTEALVTGASTPRRSIEKTLANTQPKDDLGLPDIQLMVTEELAVIDNLSGKLYLIVYADTTQPESFSKARQRLKDLRMMLRRGVDAPVTSSSVRTEAVRRFLRGGSQSTGQSGR